LVIDQPLYHLYASDRVETIGSTTEGIAVTIAAQFEADVILITPALPTLAQSSKASLAGRVVDQNQATITGAQVILSNKGANKERTFVTDASGSYRFDELQPGEYQLMAVARGFSIAEQTVFLKSGEIGAIDLTLQLSSLAETVLVTSSHLLVSGEIVEPLKGLST
jgi:Fe(3+) dicitrate transport protein